MPKITFVDPPPTFKELDVNAAVFVELRAFADWAEEVLSQEDPASPPNTDPAFVWAQAHVFANNLSAVAKRYEVMRAWRARIYRDPEGRKAVYADE
jgi:hypothetical protein